MPCNATVSTMHETTAQRQYRRDAKVLGEIGAVLSHSELPTIDVRPPSALARLAVEAWERDDEGPLDPESYEQRIQRHRAGTLALIGLAVSEHGRPDGDEVVVALYPAIIASAVGASNDLPSTP
jgi:hypothetical protein